MTAGAVFSVWLGVIPGNASREGDGLASSFSSTSDGEGKLKSVGSFSQSLTFDFGFLNSITMTPTRARTTTPPTIPMIAFVETPSDVPAA